MQMHMMAILLVSSCTMYNLIHQQGTLRNRPFVAFMFAGLVMLIMYTSRQTESLQQEITVDNVHSDIERPAGNTADALDEAVTGKPGNPTGANQYSGIVDNVHNSTDRESPTYQVDNINLDHEKTPGGTEATYTLRRLKRDAPALAQRNMLTFPDGPPRRIVMFVTQTLRVRAPTTSSPVSAGMRRRSSRGSSGGRYRAPYPFSALSVTPCTSCWDMTLAPDRL